MKTINPLRAGLLIFTLLTIIGMIAFKLLPGSYEVSVKDAVQDDFLQASISPGDFLTRMNENPDNMIVVDIRDEESFKKGHLEKAIHIPAKDLMHRKSLKALRKKDVYVYAHSEAESHRMSYLLAMMGVKAVAINSNYENLSKVIDGKAGPADFFRSEEKIRYDYARHFKAFKETAPEPVTITIIKPKAGGC
jgi:rhodanese-related sulfurtransferase